MYVTKNMTAELRAVPLGTFDDLLMQLLEEYKKCVAVYGGYLERK